MKIAEAANVSGLSIDTIRFYERVGVVANIARGADGHRVFSAQDVRWLRLFERLRSTGMPLSEMKAYAAFARNGASSLAQRRAMLETHRDRLDKKQSEIRACRDLIDEKNRRLFRVAGGV